MTSLMPYRFNHSPANRVANSLWSDDFFRPFFWGGDAMSGAFRVDVRDMGDHYLLEADMPGIDRDKVNIEVDDGVLTISVNMDETRKEEKGEYIYNERRSGSMRRSFTLNGINEEAITAEYKDGVLMLNMPKQDEQKPMGRRIEIK